MMREQIKQIQGSSATTRHQRETWDRDSFLFSIKHQPCKLRDFRCLASRTSREPPGPATNPVALCYDNCKTRKFCNRIVFLHLYSYHQSCELPEGSSCVLFHSLAHSAWYCMPALFAENQCQIQSNKRAPEILSIAAGLLLNLQALAKSPRALPSCKTSKLHSGETHIYF